LQLFPSQLNEKGALPVILEKKGGVSVVLLSCVRETPGLISEAVCKGQQLVLGVVWFC